VRNPVSYHKVQKSITQGWDEVAKEYSQDRTGIFGRCADRLLEFLKPQRGSSLLDVGCGSGAVAFKVIDRLGPEGLLIGADISGEMLRIAKSQSAMIDMSPAFFQMDAMQLALAPNSFDYVSCAYSLFQFPNMESALREMWRVLKPGGLIGLSNWGPGFFTPIASLQRDLFREFKIRPILTNPLTFNPETLEIMLVDTGFDSIELMQERDEFWFANPEEVWAYNMDMGPFHFMLRNQLSREQQTALHNQFIIMTEELKTEDGIKSTFHPIYAIAAKGG
jgi:ubiquinone/menaquinone biosynthesis C-methylase UbiE